MKKTIYFILLIFVFSCSNASENEKEIISGKWNLLNVSGDFSAEHKQLIFSKGDVIWTFNEHDKKLIVKNKIVTFGIKQSISGLPSGTYTFNKNENGTYTINDRNVKIKFTSDQHLEIDYGRETDGAVYKFNK